MTIVTAEKVWTWSPEVLSFAEQANVAAYLDPLLEATRDLFSSTGDIRVYLDIDDEIPDDRHIVWGVSMPFTTVPDYVAAQKRWIGELGRICPAPLTCTFRLNLRPVRNEPA